MRNRRISAALGLGLAACLGVVAGSPGSARAARAADDPELPYYSDATLTPTWTGTSHRVGSFSLVDQTGRRFGDGDLRGRIHIASFVFTTCPSLCPALMSRLLPVQDALAARGRDDVLMVSFSVTPRIDTPAALSAFGAARGVDARRWRLLTTLDGSADPIERVMRESYFASDDRGRLLHTERVVLVDAAGRLRGVYNGTQRFEMERLVEDVDALAGSDRAR